MKKIIHLVYCFDIGGLEKVMTDTVNKLPMFEHIIISLTYATDQSRQSFHNPVLIHELHKKPGNDWSIWKKLFTLFKTLKADVLHTYNLPTLEYQFLAAICLIPNRIHAEHGRDISDPEGKNAKYRFLRKILNPFINKWVPVSGDLAHWLKNDIRINQRKIKLIHNGIDCDLFKPNSQVKKDSTLENFANEENLVIGTIGRLDPVKNQKILVELFKELNNENPILAAKTKIVIIGNGPIFEDLKTLIEENQLEHKVWLPGARYNIMELHNAFDVFVLPSIAEGIPMTVLEAMATGKPVIVSDVGGLSEIVTKSTGILVPANDIQALTKAVIDMLESPGKRKETGQNARKHIKENFSLESMVNHYKQLYQG